MPNSFMPKEIGAFAKRMLPSEVPWKFVAPLVTVVLYLVQTGGGELERWLEEEEEEVEGDIVRLVRGSYCLLVGGSSGNLKL